MLGFLSLCLLLGNDDEVGKTTKQEAKALLRFELLRDAKREEFRGVSKGVVAEYKEKTKEALGVFGSR